MGDSLGFDSLRAVLHVMGSGKDTPVLPSPRRTSCLQILVAFMLFDTDGDGNLAFEEVKTYITSVLRVIRALGQDATGEFWGEQQGRWLADWQMWQGVVAERFRMLNTFPSCSSVWRYHHQYPLQPIHTVSPFLVQPAIADPDELGAALATQCFSQAKLPVDGKLGIDGE